MYKANSLTHMAGTPAVVVAAAAAVLVPAVLPPAHRCMKLFLVLLLGMYLFLHYHPHNTTTNLIKEQNIILYLCVYVCVYIYVLSYV